MTTTDLIDKLKDTVEEFCPEGSEKTKAIFLLASDNENIAGTMHGTGGHIAEMLYEMTKRDSGFGEILVEVAKAYTMRKITEVTAAKTGKNKKGKTLLN